jgi:hypothetical protein
LKENFSHSHLFSVSFKACIISIIIGILGISWLWPSPTTSKSKPGRIWEVYGNREWEWGSVQLLEKAMGLVTWHWVLPMFVRKSSRMDTSEVVHVSSFPARLAKGQIFCRDANTPKNAYGFFLARSKHRISPPCGSHCSILCILSSHKVALLQLHMLHYHSFRIKLFGTYSMYLP